MRPSNHCISAHNSRLGSLSNLLFFVLLFLSACRYEPNEPRILFKENRAVSVLIPEKIYAGIDADSLNTLVKIRLAKIENATSILGEYRSDHGLIFTPLIPFTQGTDYEILVKGLTAAHFSIPLANSTDAPNLTTCYPQQDSLPENLLKIYLQFSHPMREGLSDKYIRIIKNGTDTLQDVFLNLQPELWNENRTVLTVWLDPGRIKRDLQPNLRLGNPLQANNTYQLQVSKQWKDINGRVLQKDYSKKFIVTQRDSICPNPEIWKMNLPKSGSPESLVISFGESLDHYLLMEAMQISTTEGVSIKGTFEWDSFDRSCRFTPAAVWMAGNYVLTIASRLEDLAGNNLNRPFDRDMTKTKKPSTQELYKKYFRIEK